MLLSQLVLTYKLQAIPCPYSNCYADPDWYDGVTDNYKLPTGSYIQGSRMPIALHDQNIVHFP
jgi:hypothetical protein